MQAVSEILDQYPDAARDMLIPILQDVQDQQGYISRESVTEISRRLNLPAGKIYGVATFYNQFRFEPRGKHHIQVCRGTACHVKGSARLLEVIESELNIKAGQTTRDKLFSLEVVACIGACGLAPVMTVDGEFHADVQPEKVGEILQTCREQDDADHKEQTSDTK